VKRLALTDLDKQGRDLVVSLGETGGHEYHHRSDRQCLHA
jgi:hypothetical protein